MIVDGIGDEYSQAFCKKMQTLLQEKHHINAPIGKRITQNCLNLYLIHNAAYYLDGNAPHQKQHPDAAVQHITFEDFTGHEEHALSTVVHELLIKSDLRAEQIRLFDALLPLMNVTFVRNGQLTVVPFPFMYLREHILSLGYAV